MSMEVQIKKRLSSFELDVEFETSGERLGILGASGAGKSMTLKCIAGIENPDSGRIVLGGRVLFDSRRKINLTPQERSVGYLFQDYALFPNMTVARNIASAIRLPRRQRYARVTQFIEFFHLHQLDNRYPCEISGGERQRVALARVLASEPIALMLDEPFSALDTYLREQLQLQMQRGLKNYGGDVLLVTHGLDEVYRFCERVLVLDRGTVVSFGSPKDVFENPGSLTTAKVSGCYNISRAKMTGQYTVMALDWGFQLVTRDLVSREVSHVGIRPHGLKPAGQQDTENVLTLEPVEVIHGPSAITVVLSSRGDGEALDEQCLWWKLTPEEWYRLYRQRAPRRFSVMPEDVMLLR
ncbi:MAG: sulfate/molybdate ABC transporter ATP-binding protein [Bacillota bacterium]